MSKITSKRLYIVGASLATLALAAVLAGIWSDDGRWGQTCGAFVVAAFVFGAAGVFVNIHEDFS